MVSDATWVARIDLEPGPTVIPDLYPLIPNRHTNRYPYDIGRSVTSATLDALSALNDDPEVRVFWFASAPLRKQVGDLLVEATHVSVSDTTQIGESDGWYRATWQDLQQYRDGITIDAAGLPDWKRTLGKMLPPQSQEQQDSTFLQNTADQAQTAGAFGLLTVRDGQDRAQQLRAGWLLEQGNVRFTRSILKGW